MSPLLFFADACSLPHRSGFLGFPYWYTYLQGQQSNGKCIPALTGLTDIWLIVAAVIEILLQIAAIVAVIMVIYGAVGFITSQGNAEETNKARSTIINALIGLLLTVMAATFVNFVARSIN